ncbi:MAG: hypothetical protein OEO23_16050 [Gemmatimonadota bacterium]|nr:hypothetical protein [Gemmatimonadota bacterium]
MKTQTVALLAGLMTAGFVAQAPVAADMVEIAGAENAVVRVVNLHKNDVRVYVFDQEGRRSLLGTVEAGEFAELAIDEALLAEGPVQVKAYPLSRIPGLGSPAEGDNGVRSNKLYLDGGDVVDFWLEPNLEASMLRVTRG